jgi:copper chaperone
MSTELIVSVAGMTCNHCVSSVSTELLALPGVVDVNVELAAEGASRVRITSEAALEDSSVADAIKEAGYEMVGTSE